MRRITALWVVGLATAIAIVATLREDESIRTSAVTPPTESTHEPVTASADPWLPQRTVAEPPTMAPTFGELVDEVVELAIRTHESIEDEDMEVARELDATTRDRVTALRREFHDAGELALFALTGLLSEDESLAGMARRRVLLTLIELGLHDRWQRFEVSGSRQSIDAFVAAILASIPQDEHLASELSALLDQRPFLGVAHEQAVLKLVQMAEAERFLSEPAERLLRTLWRNLESTGARRSASLASLALVFIDDANPSRQRVALEHLLSIENGRYEQFVVDRVMKLGDRKLAKAVGMAAAADLPPDRAIRVLEQLSDAGFHDRFTAAFMALGQRAPEAMATAYEQKLADGVAPHVRAELVTGAGFGGRGAVQLAQTAFAFDPDPEVRSRALFVLSADAAPEIAEQRLLEALDDERFCGEPSRLGVIVSALKNLASQGAYNALHRIGMRLSSHPGLEAQARRDLEEILARYTPDRGR